MIIRLFAWEKRLVSTETVALVPDMFSIIARSGRVYRVCGLHLGEFVTDVELKPIGFDPTEMLPIDVDLSDFAPITERIDYEAETIRTEEKKS